MLTEYPNPDLAIEVDVSPSKSIAEAIYAALRVAEVWRFDGASDQVVIERLSDDGTYRIVDASSFLPVSAEELTRWVFRKIAPDPSGRPGCGPGSARVGSAARTLIIWWRHAFPLERPLGPADRL